MNIFLFLILVDASQEGLCNKESAPSVSSISRVLRGGQREEEGDLDPARPSHSIDGILGKSERSLMKSIKVLIS